jgi:hypothetical protein
VIRRCGSGVLTLCGCFPPAPRPLTRQGLKNLPLVLLHQPKTNLTLSWAPLPLESTGKARIIGRIFDVFVEALVMVSHSSVAYLEAAVLPLGCSSRCPCLLDLGSSSSVLRFITHMQNQ